MVDLASIALAASHASTHLVPSSRHFLSSSSTTASSRPQYLRTHANSLRRHISRHSVNGTWDLSVALTLVLRRMN